MKRFILGMILLYVPLVAAAEAIAPMQRLAIVRADGVRVEFSVELALSDEQRRQGLMGRRQLAARHGMLFDFEQPTLATMWMKDTLISLDMLFLDERGRVIWACARTTPQSLALITAPEAARYVLEVNGGEAEALGIARGDRALVNAMPPPNVAASPAP